MFFASSLWYKLENKSTFKSLISRWDRASSEQPRLAVFVVTHSTYCLTAGGPLVIINTACLLPFDRTVLRSRLNKPSCRFWSHRKATSRSREHLFEEAEDGKSAGGRRRGGGFTSKMPPLICHKVMKCRYLPLKNFCPADAFQIYVFSFPLLPHSSTFKHVATKGGLKYFPPPTLHPPKKKKKNIEDGRTRRLKMYMQMQATLEHTEVVNKLTRGRNNSV